ncbi:MAG: DNA gyrase inhibitor YacG [bacterium]|nr:DNA gyrase inhibitor YacG [bacterium]
MSTKCPNCSQNSSKENKCYPFCSDRCQLLDLGSWASEKYKTPAQEMPEGFENEDLEIPKTDSKN